MRSMFTNVRVIIPHAAMSAATMLACSANRILMGTHSFLGPIDPQFILQTETGRSAVPAHAILAQFELAKKECADPTKLAAWIPMLRQYGPALLVQCQLAQDLSRSLVGEWLEK
jgi:membrane-bound ClpP family serine protease